SWLGFWEGEKSQGEGEEMKSRDIKVGVVYLVYLKNVTYVLIEEQCRDKNNKPFWKGIVVKGFGEYIGKSIYLRSRDVFEWDDANNHGFRWVVRRTLVRDKAAHSKPKAKK